MLGDDEKFNDWLLGVGTLAVWGIHFVICLGLFMLPMYLGWKIILSALMVASATGLYTWMVLCHKEEKEKIERRAARGY